MTDRMDIQYDAINKGCIDQNSHCLRDYLKLAKNLFGSALVIMYEGCSLQSEGDSLRRL